VADFRPVESTKARILSIHPAPVGTSLEDANAEWIEVVVQLSSDLANWRLQHLRALWREELAKPVEWEWIYTWGSPSFVREGGRKHVYAAGPIAAARLVWTRGDYARLVDAFGTVIDEIVVWPAPPAEAKAPAKA